MNILNISLKKERLYFGKFAFPKVSWYTSCMSLHQIQIQKQILAPALQQSIEILLLPILELNQTIELELQKNPLLDAKDINGHESLENINAKEQVPFSQDDKPYLFSVSKNQPQEDIANESLVFQKETTLEDDLFCQLKCELSDPSDIKIGEFVIGNLDEDGYLQASDEEIAQAAQVEDMTKIHAVLEKIQSFDPPGIAARGLRECLILQANRKLPQDGILTKRIISSCLEDVARKRYQKIARDLKVPLKEVTLSCQIIATLDPRPARNHRPLRSNTYVKPDIYILKDSNDQYIIHVNRQNVPHLSVNPSYQSMLKNPNLKPEEREYIREKISSANQFIRSIEQRGETLYRIAEFILEHQTAFFDEGPIALRPMILRDVASALERNESTISRAIKSKYIETPHGLFPLKFFFSQGINNGHHGPDGAGIVANRSVKEELRRLIAEEETSAPLSDQEIEKYFLQQGIRVARRTIAKYRKELHILPAHLRKA